MQDLTIVVAGLAMLVRLFLTNAEPTSYSSKNPAAAAIDARRAERPATIDDGWRVALRPCMTPSGDASAGFAIFAFKPVRLALCGALN